MIKGILAFCAAAGVLLTGVDWVVAAEDQNRTQSEVQAQEQIYGSQLMTPEERMEYRARMLGARTMEERERIRWEHHEQMKKRAKEQGITLPDEPPERGMRPGMGRGRGSGVGDGRR